MSITRSRGYPSLVSFPPPFDREANVRAFGALGDNGTQDDALAINEAVAYVADNWGGGKIIVPPGDYGIDTEVLLDSDYLTLEIQPGATLIQRTYGLAAVQIWDADHCTVTGGGTLINPVTKTEITGVGVGGFNGNPARSRAAGVYQAGTNYCTVSDLTIYNFVVGCGYYQIEAAALTTWNMGNRILRVNLEHFDFGFTGSNQRDMLIEGCHGYYTDRSQGTVVDDDNGPAPHFIYMSGKINNNLKNQNITIANCHDFFNPHSSSYKAKYTDGITFNCTQSQLTVRGFDLDIQNGRLVSPIVRDLVGQTAISFAATSSECEVISPLVYLRTEVELSAYAAYLAIVVGFTGAINFDTLRAFTTDEETSNIIVRGGRFSHFRTTNEWAAQLGGKNIRVFDTVFEERGANTHPISIKSTAVDCQVIRPIVRHGQVFTATSGTYNSSSGAVVLNVSANATIPIGATVVVSGATGTGSFASINGTVTTITGTVGEEIKYTIGTGLTMTITGATVQAGTVGVRVADIATGALRTTLEIDPLVLDFTYGSGSLSDSGTSTLQRLTTWTGGPVTTGSATYTMLLTDAYLICDRAAGKVTVTLPPAALYTGWQRTIKTVQAQLVESASANVVPLVGGAAAVNLLAATAGKWATLVSDGTNWVIMAGN